MGRDRNPGEIATPDLANVKETHHRTLLSQVTAVDTENGAVCLTVRGMPSGGRWATVPVLWASFPQGAGPAWGRYMPFESDIYKTTFDFDDTIRLVGHDLTANDDTVSPQVADGRVGWPSIAQKAGGNSDDPTFAGFQDFRALERGEYDFMSTGGAYVYGNNVGQLYLAGGATNFIMVDRVQSEIHCSTDTYIWESHGYADFRMGVVKRSLPTSPGESVVYSRPTGLEPIPDQEFTATLNNSAPGGLSYKIAQMSIGAVTTAAGTPDLTGTGVKRLSMTTYSGIETAGIGLWDYSVDNTGSTYENILTGTVISLQAPLANRSELLASHTGTFSGAVTLTVGSTTTITTGGATTLTTGGVMTMTSGGIMTMTAGGDMNMLAPIISMNAGIPGIGGVIQGGAWELAMAAPSAAIPGLVSAAAPLVVAASSTFAPPALAAAIVAVQAEVVAVAAWIAAWAATLPVVTSKTVCVGL